MKKGFTLIELLIVVVILVTLMSIVFRLGNVGSESEKRAVTIDRIQRFENALSGYYAAFGMYPPVKMHNSPNVFLKVDEEGRQSGDQESATITSGQAMAACKAQPIGCEYPFANNMADIIKEKCGSIPSEEGVFFDDGYSDNIGRFSDKWKSSNWNEIKLFKFGALSYLLPRYLFMMGGDESFFSKYNQWTANNKEPSDALTGAKMSWSSVRKNTSQGRENETSASQQDFLRVANIPSQSVCARWMASFEKTLYATRPHTFFGVEVVSKDRHDVVSVATYVQFPEYVDGIVAGKCSRIYYPDNDYNGSKSNGYILDFITVNDGWLNELLYYSPPPHQTYMVWSAGPNGNSFPPWISREKFSAADNKNIGEWIKDDIISQSN